MRQAANRRQGRIVQWLPAKTSQFPSLFSEVLRFCLHLFNVKGTVETKKTVRDHFPHLFSFQPDYF
jgi:hypothetical protein